MIHEYAAFATFFILNVLLYIISSGRGLSRELLQMQESNLAETSSFTKLNSRMNYNRKLIQVLIIIIFLSRFIQFIFLPEELRILKLFPSDSLTFLLISFFYLIGLALSYYFISIAESIKSAERMHYIKNVMNFGLIVAISDILLTTLFYVLSLENFFSGNYTLANIFIGDENWLTPIVFTIILLIVTISSTYILFSLKRSLKILRQYWIILLFLLITIILLWFNQISHALGWFENSREQLKLFTFSYGFTGWIFLIIFALAIFCNCTVLVLLRLKDKLNNPQQFKIVIISFVKIGFYATLSFCGLCVFPLILIWFY